MLEAARLGAQRIAAAEARMSDKQVNTFGKPVPLLRVKEVEDAWVC